MFIKKKKWNYGLKSQLSSTKSVSLAHYSVFFFFLIYIYIYINNSIGTIRGENSNLRRFENIKRCVN